MLKPPAATGMEDQPPLPKHIAWFAPWTWKRARWMMIALAIITYHLSWPIVLLLLWKLEVAFPERGVMSTGVKVCSVVYAPIFALGQRCPPYAWLIDVELDTLTYLFGDPLKGSRAAPQR